MKKTGCVVAVVGLLLCLGSFVLFGTEIVRAMQGHEVATVPLPLATKIETPLMTVDTAKLCSISVKGTISSDASADRIKYRFPFRYTVYDSNGNELVTEKRDFAYDEGTRATQIGRTTNVVQDYKSFKVAPPGAIRIEAEIDPDTMFRATANDLRIVVRDQISAHTRHVVAGFAVLGLGLLAAVGGLITFLIGLARAPRRPAGVFSASNMVNP